MESEERAKVTEQTNLLRTELKAWEREFATANGGKKAGRDDIKQNPSIAQKYKDYNKLRDILSGKIKLSAPSSPRNASTSRKRKSDVELPTQTPTKKQHLLKTPSKAEQHPANIDPYDSPSVIRNLFSPQVKRVIGPTPQKDGQVLGLFDLLQDESEQSPLKGGDAAGRRPDSSYGTPRKSRFTEEGLQTQTGHTPSATRQRLSDGFATPLKKKDVNEQGVQTPSSVSKLSFATPSFLRRDSQRATMPTIDENGNDMTLSPGVRRPRRPLVRGLSSILAGLRKMEDEAFEDDLEALQDMENEEELINQTGQEGQMRLLGGFDDEAALDSELEDEGQPALGPDGQPRKPWKKKGQKRTTRRVKMKPVINKPAAVDNKEQEFLTIPEAQFDDLQDVEDPNLSDNPDDNESISKDSQKSRGSSGKMATVKRKAANALAHANFKRLKLRNSGAKGGPGYNSRFRRKK